jgi:MFS family permease
MQSGIGRVWAELVEGLRATLSIAWLWRMIALSAVANIFFAGALSVALPLLAEARLGGPAGFGAVLAAMAVGSVLAVLAIGRAERLWRRGILYYAGFVAAGSGMLLLAFVQDLVLAILVAAFVGAAVAGFVLILETVIQELVPAPILGRVASLESFGSLALLPVGYLLVGVLIGFVGPALAMALLGTATVLAGFIGLGSRSIRSIR